MKCKNCPWQENRQVESCMTTHIYNQHCWNKSACLLLEQQQLVALCCLLCKFVGLIICLLENHIYLCYPYLLYCLSRGVELQIRGISFTPIDPMDLSSEMRYFPRVSPNSLKISPIFKVNIKIQSIPYAHLSIKNEIIPFAM